MENKGSGGSWVLAIVVIVVIVGLFESCSGGESKYERDFQNGIEKYNKGEKMTQDEYDAVKDFKDWQDKNSEKTYSDWDN